MPDKVLTADELYDAAHDLRESLGDSPYERDAAFYLDAAMDAINKAGGCLARAAEPDEQPPS